MKDYWFVDSSAHDANKTNIGMAEQGWEFHSMISYRDYRLMMCFQRDHIDEQDRFEE